MMGVSPSRRGKNEVRITYHRSALISVSGVLFCLQAIVDKGRASFHAEILHPFEYIQHFPFISFLYANKGVPINMNELFLRPKAPAGDLW